MCVCMCVDESQIHSLHSELVRVYPEGLWSLICNAGICESFFVEFTDMTDYQKTMQVNYFGNINIIKTFLPLVKKNKGRIIVTSSFVGKVKRTSRKRERKKEIFIHR